MPSLVASLEGTIARMYSQLGVDWPNPWWPTGNSDYDDCAACVSWALWGLNGNQPYQTVVSGIIERSGLPFIAGNQGIQRGDLMGFRWSTDVNYDHIEVALNSPDGSGNFLTIGTNGSPTDDMAVRTRNIYYVHNYARPAYASLAETGTSTLINTQEDETMKFIFSPGLNSNIGYAPGVVIRYSPDVWNEHFAALNPGVPFTDASIQAPTVADAHLPSFLFTEAGLPTNTQIAVNVPWRADAGASTGGGNVTIDNTKVLAEIAKLPTVAEVNAVATSVKGMFAKAGS